MAKLYYQEFKKQMAADPTKKLRVATIFSYGANEEESDGILGEENSEDTSALDQTSRDFLEEAIEDYNKMFHTNYDTSSDRFQNYYKDVSLRMKNKELDILIVVNMFLTGFDATTLNTLWVDKNLKMHGLIQAFLGRTVFLILLRPLEILCVSEICRSVWIVQFLCLGTRMPEASFYCRVLGTIIMVMSPQMESLCRAMWT